MIKEGVIIGNRYEIMGRIGTGGMADVYKAVDRVLNRYVAVKILKREFREDENFVKKFRSEARAAAGLTHPNIVNVYDVAEDRGLYYIVMELVEGITLKDYIQKKGQLSPKEVIGIMMQVCSGIETAHDNRIVHRDIKPQNIIISKEGKVKVTDFGIAKATSSNTISTNAMGSVHYTSPEQARGGFSDEKSDIYSLGITMYEMVTGRLPFDGDSTVTIALKHLQEDMIPPSEFVPDMPYSLEQIILKCTQKSADRRYIDVAQLSRDLRRSAQDPDGDFVRISPLKSASGTVIITAEELERIQSGGKYDPEYDEYDDYDDEDEKPVKKVVKEEKTDIDPKMTKIMKILTIVVAVIFALILLFIIGYATNIIKFGPGISQSEAKNIVPDLVGKSEEEAEAACAEAGLKMKVVKRKDSLEQEEGYVYGQKTQEGTALPEGAVVQVEVSSGKLIEIPDLSEMDYIDARDELIDLGFSKKKIKIKEETHDEIAEGKVTRTEPKEEKIVRKDSEVTIYVSSGLEMVKVPDLYGKTKEEAEQALTEAGLVGSVTEEESDLETGTVIRQDVDADDKVPKGSSIKYVIAKAKKQVKIPTDLVGKNMDEVQKKLKDKKLEAEIVYKSFPGYEYGVVVEVEGEGTEVSEGSSVKVYVSNWRDESQEGGGTGNGATTGTNTGGNGGTPRQ